MEVDCGPLLKRQGNLYNLFGARRRQASGTLGWCHPSRPNVACKSCAESLALFFFLFHFLSFFVKYIFAAVPLIAKLSARDPSEITKIIHNHGTTKLMMSVLCFFSFYSILITEINRPTAHPPLTNYTNYHSTYWGN